ncbi:MAG TPA: glycosyltransferase family 39 protein, partial [Candidatus Bathyarchaeia archaeon]|nr:glycosyltransferase family 39 protein [Candidatus Bathyarchaeia archaeon]
FYYFQYISANLFGSVAPPVFAYPDLLFSILTVPLLFVFLKLFFKSSTALLVTALYATNFVVIQFSRFAWNPNSIPFWTLLIFFALLRAADEKRQTKRYIWVLLVAIGWAVVGQLHFVALAAVPAVIFFFLLWTGKWKNFGWKEAALVFFVMVLLFAPVILSDVKLKGDNIKQFMWAFKYKPKEHGLAANLAADVTMHANYYAQILTTYISPTGKASLAAGAALVLFGLTYIFVSLKKETDESRKIFLKLIFSWAAVSYLVLIPFAFQIKPRFLFFEIFVPFIFVGFGIEWLLNGKKWKKMATAAVIAAVAGLVCLNTEATLAWFGKFGSGDDFKVWGGRHPFVQYPKEITVSDNQKVADYVETKWLESNRAKLYFYGNLELRNPPIYILETKNPGIDYSYFSYRTKDFSGRYFSITTAEGGFESLPKQYRPKFDMVENKIFPKLAVQELNLKELQPKLSEEESLKAPKAPSKPGKNIENKIKKSDRVLWGDLF